MSRPDVAVPDRRLRARRLVGWILAALLLVAGAYAYHLKARSGEIARALWEELQPKDAGIDPAILSEPLFQDLRPGKATSQADKSGKTPRPGRAVTPPPSTPAARAATSAPAAVPTSRAPAATPAAAVAGRTATVTPARTTPSAAPTPIQQAAAVSSASASPAATPAPAAPEAAAAVTAPAVRPDLDAGSSRPNPFTDRVHILLIANDQERIGAGRADSIMLLTLDPGAQQLRVLSIPRDTRMFIPGRGVDKVNHAYAFGGARLLNRTLQLFLGFPFQYYVEVSYGGFRQAIDEVGGVDVTSPFPFTYEGQTFAGAMHLNGVQALAFSRMRKLDPDGDFGRERRQQAVVRALLQELGRIPLDNPSRLNAFAERLIPYVRTDLSPARIVKLRALHPYAVQAPATLRMAGQGRMIRGIYYFEVADAERRRLHVALR